MKHFFLKQVFILVIGIIVLPRLALAQPQKSLVPHVWGVASNGLCVGVCIRQSDWPSHPNDFYCDIDVRNMTTNRLYIWVPPFEQRYEIELRGPDNLKVRQLKPFFWSQKTLWFVGRPLSTNENNCLDWCFLKDTFDVRTNGQFALIASVRANAFTNFGIGHHQMKHDLNYFLLPPVTNVFNILP